MHQRMTAAKDPYNPVMRWLPFLLLSLLLPAAAQAGDPLEVTNAETQALVDAIRDRPLSPEQHGLLVGLGAQAQDATGQDRLYVGWALVFADRPDLGIPLVRRGLAEVRLGAADALRTLLFAEAAGQDGLVRATLDLLRGTSPEGARRLERSIRQAPSFATAQQRARAALKGLESGTLEVPFEAGDARRVTWWVRPAAPTGPTVVWLPDGGRAEGLPPRCQDEQRLKEAAQLARAGHAVYLPGLRGCDGSDGTYRGSADAAKDLAALVPRVREAEGGRPVVLLGLEEGALLALRVADRAGVDRVVAWQPVDPGEADHLPLAVIEARDLAALPSVPVRVDRPYPALAALLGVEAPEWVALPRRLRGRRATELMVDSAAPAEAR